MKRYFLYIITAVISVITLSGGGCNDDNSNVTGTGSGYAPTAPSALTASVPVLGSIQLTWSDNSGNEIGFVIERSVNVSNNWLYLATLGANSGSYLDTGLTGGTTYYYRVYAYNSNGNSGMSNVVSQTVQVTDPDVMIFSNLVVSENNGTSSSPTALNLLSGQVDSAASNNKDVVLVDQNGSGTNFYFRSGDLSFLDNIAIGYQTQFGQFIEWNDITEAQWDTLSRIWKSTANADTLTAVDFQGVDTRYPGSEYFVYPLTTHRVYAFYLKGKYQSGITPKPVFGMIYLKSASNVGGLFPFRLTVDVKINIAGRNQFKQLFP